MSSNQKKVAEALQALDSENHDQSDSADEELMKSMFYNEMDSSLDFCHTEDDLNSKHGQLDKILIKVGASIKTVSFIHCDMLEPKTIFQILSRLEHVNKIYICDNTLKTQPGHFDFQSLTDVELKHLKNVVFQTRTNLETLLILKIAPLILAKTEAIEILKLNCQIELLGDDADPYKGVRDAISRQKNMIDLSICDGNFFNGSLENPKFELKTLDMLSDNGVTFKVTKEIQYTHMGQFLKTQKNCETVFFGSNVAFLREPLKNVYFELFKSKSSAISVSLNVQSAKEMMKILVDDGFSNPNVIIFDCNMFGNNLKDHQIIIEASVKIFPNIHYLQLGKLSEGESSMSSILEPLNQLQKLQSFVASTYSCLEIAGICVPKLTSLEIHSADFMLHNLKTFISNNLKIEKISISFDSNKYDDSELHHICDLIEYSLKHLKIVFMRFAIKTSVEDIENLIEVGKVQSSIDNLAHQDKFKMIEFYNYEGELCLRFVNYLK